MTGLDRYRVAADRLTELQVRRQPSTQRENDARDEAQPALHAEPPADTVR